MYILVYIFFNLESNKINEDSFFLPYKDITMYSTLEAGMEISTLGQRAIDWGAKSTILGELYAKISSHFEQIQDGRRAIEVLEYKKLKLRHKNKIPGRWQFNTYAQIGHGSSKYLHNSK